MVGCIDQCVAPAIEVVIAERYRPEQFVLVAGDKGWNGCFSFKNDDMYIWLGNQMRRQGFEAVLLNLGDDTWVQRWDGRRWILAEDNPHAVAEELGVPVPEPERQPTRARREAALIVGPSLADLARLADDPAHLIQTSRGVVMLDEIGLCNAFGEGKGATLHKVTRYLDDNSFRYSLTTPDDDVHVYAYPVNESVTGLPTIQNVEGETDPRRIIRALGIPEDFMFPEQT